MTDTVKTEGRAQRIVGVEAPPRTFPTIIDGNEAAAFVAYHLSDVIAIYPITPSSPMGEWADQWASEGKPNLWGAVPSVIEMQSEGGAAGAIHGALQTGSLATTFTASQGLLLMLPNMFKIAGELTPAVFHVSARTVATHALSIFGDQSDVMAARSTGWGMLASASVQEALDQALIAHAATLESRVPIVHFFDGFRTSHEVMKIRSLNVGDLRAMINDQWVAQHRARALNPSQPVLRGSAQNPDVFFQAREAVNPYYAAFPDLMQKTMDRFAELTGRAYRLFDYFGHPEAERVVVLMGSGAETSEEAVDRLVAEGERVGVVRVRLFRPFDGYRFVQSLPATTKCIAGLDRTKEPGAAGEPLYQDVVTALNEHQDHPRRRLADMPRVIGGRYGLSSKEFTPAMVKGVFDELKEETPKNHFTVGIVDDVTLKSIDCDPGFITEDQDSTRAVFYGLGADGTVGANKNSIKIIGKEAGFHAQGYFVYDSKKSGSVTVSHLRFGHKPIHSAYLIQQANFVACHQPTFIDRLEMLDQITTGGTFLLNTPTPPDRVWDTLPSEMKRRILAKNVKIHVIDAIRVAREAGLGGRINTIMQTCFFALSGVLPRDKAIAKIKDAIRKSYGSKGEDVVVRNCAAVDQAQENLFEVRIGGQSGAVRHRPPVVPEVAPDFVRGVVGPILEGRGDQLPVSAMPADGTFPVGTTKWEKRNIALEIPQWDSALCIQCNKCALVCPHAAIRPNVYEKGLLENAPESFLSVDARGAEFKGLRFTLQVAPEDCTGCGLCVEICPVENRKETGKRAIYMVAQAPLRERERTNFEFFQTLPEFDRTKLKTSTVKGSQFCLPLFEYSGACAGCGETPYVKLLSQLFGDRAVIANATGCSSIYGGNLPTTPWTTNTKGQGPAWSNSLFEDNAEFGLGFRLSLDHQSAFARQLLRDLRAELDPARVEGLLSADQSDEAGLAAQRARVEELKIRLRSLDGPASRNLEAVADSLVMRSVWIVGGDGWAYDIGYGGLDHVLASGRNVNVLVLDTEVYSNTGGQMSKATPCAAIAKFASGGKPSAKKDLGRLAMDYGNVYVASIALGANDNHTVQAFVEAESFDGPSLIIAYGHCIAHGIDMRTGLSHQKDAVDSGHWILYRHDPRRAERGLNPLQLDSKKPNGSLGEFMAGENRFHALTNSDPRRAAELLDRARQGADRRYAIYERLAQNADEPRKN